MTIPYHAENMPALVYGGESVSSFKTTDLYGQEIIRTCSQSKCIVRMGLILAGRACAKMWNSLKFRIYLLSCCSNQHFETGDIPISRDSKIPLKVNTCEEQKYHYKYTSTLYRKETVRGNNKFSF